MRTIELKNDKLHEILRKKDGLITEGREISKEIEAKEKDRNKIGLKVQKLKDKAAKLIEKEEITLEEFEYLHQVDQKDDMVEVTIQDRVEEFKDAVRKQKEEQEKA